MKRPLINLQLLTYMGDKMRKPQLTAEEEELLERMPAWFKTLRKRFNAENDEDLFRLLDYFSDR